MPTRAAVLGSPIEHSLSPILHQAAYLALGLTDWSYTAIQCGVEGLPALVANSSPEVCGYSCTMPLKQAALEVADSVSRIAGQIGAANTLLRRPAGWHADNTDWQGLRDAISEADLDVQGSVVILGAGGTAQAALAALPDAGSITVAVREPARTALLLQTAERLNRRISLTTLVDETALRSAGLVISTLPGTAADVVAGFGWGKHQALLDVVYSPWPTRLSSAFASSGAAVVSGAVMLLHQAARQVELMTGSTAPIQAMREALRQAAPDCGA